MNQFRDHHGTTLVQNFTRHFRIGWLVTQRQDIRCLVDWKSAKKAENKNNKKPQLLFVWFLKHILCSICCNCLRIERGSELNKSFLYPHFTYIYLWYSKDMLVLLPRYFLNLWALSATILITSGWGPILFNHFILLLCPFLHWAFYSSHGNHCLVFFAIYIYFIMFLLWFPPYFSIMSVFPWPPLQYSSFPLSRSFPYQVLLCEILLTLISTPRYYYYVYNHPYVSLGPASLSETKYFFVNFYHPLHEIPCLRFPVSISDFLPLAFHNFTL